MMSLYFEVVIFLMNAKKCIFKDLGRDSIHVFGKGNFRC